MAAAAASVSNGSTAPAKCASAVLTARGRPRGWRPVLVFDATDLDRLPRCSTKCPPDRTHHADRPGPYARRCRTSASMIPAATPTRTPDLRRRPWLKDETSCEVGRIQGLPRKQSLSRTTSSPIELVSGKRRRARLKKLVTPKFKRISYDQLTVMDADNSISLDAPRCRSVGASRGLWRHSRGTA